jgi:DNA polymerase III alpha subunit
MFKPLALNIHGVRLPKFEYPESAYNDFNFPVDKNNNKEILTNLAREGFKFKVAKGLIHKDKIKEYGDRVKYELDCLEKTGFIDYILLVWDVCYYARKNNISIGPGRGSAAGSLVNYLIGITDIDPIKYNLYFERFISLSRAQSKEVDGIKYLTGSLPDIDLDFGDEDRQKIIDYVSHKYDGNFVKLCTVQTLSSKIVIKECFKIAEGASESESKIVSGYIPSLFGKNFSLQKSYEEVEDFRKFADAHPRVFKIAKRLYDGIKSFGSHASAYLLTYDKLNKVIPCQWGASEDGGNYEKVSSYDMYVAQDIAIKMDLLGVSSINLIHNVAKRTGKSIESIDLDDFETIYKYLQSLSLPYDLFQISGDAAIRGLAKIKPKNINHLSGVLAICRPGALSFIDNYADYVNYSNYTSIHPLFDDILKSTGGICLYQEQLMAMFVKIGFSLREADDIRRIVGKKKTDEIKEWESKIHDKAASNNIPKQAAEELWKIALASADYSFNMCLLPSTNIYSKDGIRPMSDINIGDQIKAYDVDNDQDHYVTVSNIYNSEVEVFEVELEDGRKICCSMKHKLLTLEGMVSLKEILNKNLSILTNANQKWQSVVTYNSIGIQKTLDFEVDHKDHNFYAEGVVVSNSHSISYSVVSALTVYYKFNYPKEFFVESLNIAANKGDFTSRFSKIERELKYFGIELLRPDILHSKENFEIEGNNIRYAFSAIKGIADKAINGLKIFLDHEHSNKFEVFQTAKNTKLSLPKLAAIIQSGMLNSISENRSLMVLEAQIWSQLNDKERDYCLLNGKAYDFNLIKMLKCYTEWKDTNGKAIGKESRLNTIRKNTQQYMTMYSKNSKYPDFAAYMYEKTLLGYSFSVELRDLFLKENPRLIQIKELEDLPEKSKIEIVATVDDVIKGISKAKSNPYMKLSIGDETGTYQGMIMKERLANYLELCPEPEEEDIIYIQGSKGPDIIWINKMEVQNTKIFFNSRQLKKEINS